MVYWGKKKVSGHFVMKDRKMLIAFLFVLILGVSSYSQRYGERVVYFEAMIGQIARGKVSPTKFSLYLWVN